MLLFQALFALLALAIAIEYPSPPSDFAVPVPDNSIDKLMPLLPFQVAGKETSKAKASIQMKANMKAKEVKRDMYTNGYTAPATVPTPTEIEEPAVTVTVLLVVVQTILVETQQ